MYLEMAQKVIVPQKKNYVPQFFKQRDINSYYQPVMYNIFSKLALLYIFTNMLRKDYRIFC